MRSETTNTTRSPQDLGQHIQVLTHALQGIAGSIGMAPAFVDAPQFFYNYMYDYRLLGKQAVAVG